MNGCDRGSKWAYLENLSTRIYLSQPRCNCKKLTLGAVQWTLKRLFAKLLQTVQWETIPDWLFKMWPSKKFLDPVICNLNSRMASNWTRMKCIQYILLSCWCCSYPDSEIGNRLTHQWAWRGLKENELWVLVEVERTWGLGGKQNGGHSTRWTELQRLQPNHEYLHG